MIGKFFTTEQLIPGPPRAGLSSLFYPFGGDNLGIRPMNIIPAVRLPFIGWIETSENSVNHSPSAP